MKKWVAQSLPDEALRKIPLESTYINPYRDLFDEGADFIDIIRTESRDKDDGPDEIKITVKPEYMSEDLDDYQKDRNRFKRWIDEDEKTLRVRI